MNSAALYVLVYFFCIFWSFLASKNTKNTLKNTNQKMHYPSLRGGGGAGWPLRGLVLSGPPPTRLPGRAWRGWNNKQGTPRAAVADLRSLPDRLLGWLADLLRKVERLGRWPTHLGEGYTALIPKQGPLGPRNTRPLTVLSIQWSCTRGCRVRRDTQKGFW